MTSVVFVTGASSGLMKAIARRLGDQGVAEVVFVRRPHELEGVADAVSPTQSWALPRDRTPAANDVSALIVGLSTRSGAACLDEVTVRVP